MVGHDDAVIDSKLIQLGAALRNQFPPMGDE
jgi:hypothetical protein